MIQQKLTALALAALGLTGSVFAVSAALVAQYAPQADLSLLTSFCIVGLVFGVVFIAWGGIQYDRIRQRELDDLEVRRNRSQKGVGA